MNRKIPQPKSRQFGLFEQQGASGALILSPGDRVVFGANSARPFLYSPRSRADQIYVALEDGRLLEVGPGGYVKAVDGRLLAGRLGRKPSVVLAQLAAVIAIGADRIGVSLAAMRCRQRRSRQ